MEMAATTTEMSDKQVLLRDSRDAVIVVDQLSMCCLSVLREIVVPESNGTTDKIILDQSAITLHSGKKSISGDDMLNVWTLDSATTCSIAANEKLVGDNVRLTKNKIELNTNAGSRIIDEVCDVGDIGTIRFNKDGIANILGLCDLKKKYRVTLDTAKEDAFAVCTHIR
eukprot:scaffold6228_cov96-Cylindrotheca_fusiformis.AAC.1